MRVQFFVKDEQITPWKSKVGEQHQPLTLYLDDRANDDPMQELVELRIEEESEKAKWAGKVKGRTVLVALQRINKFNGVARIQGRVIEVVGAK